MWGQHLAPSLRRRRVSLPCRQHRYNCGPGQAAASRDRLKARQRGVDAGPMNVNGRNRACARPRPRCRHKLAVTLLLVTAACTSVTPAAVPSAPSVRSLPAVEIAARFGARGLPDLTGNDAQAARGVLAARGLHGQLVAFDGSAVVTGQYPAAGGPAPTDGVVTLWLGQPPALQLPAKTKTADSGPAAPERSPGHAPVERVPGAPPEPAEGARPALPAGVDPPQGGSIRTRAPAEAGTVLTGRASWYGPGFAGRTTACGGRFDPGEPTLASRELRCGTRVLVRTRSGRTVAATVTDWGPADWTRRRFDLSQATFEALAPLGAGVIDVAVAVR